MSDSKQPTAAQQMLGNFAPKLVSLTDGVLFADVWRRGELAARDRSVITIAALVAGGNSEQLPYHLSHGKKNGLTETEIVEAITHLAFYAGWPKAMSAIMAAKKAFAG